VCNTCDSNTWRCSQAPKSPLACSRLSPALPLINQKYEN
jgi:hypothetical protein